MFRVLSTRHKVMGLCLTLRNMLFYQGISIYTQYTWWPSSQGLSPNVSKTARLCQTLTCLTHATVWEALGGRKLGGEGLIYWVSPCQRGPFCVTCVTSV